MRCSASWSLPSSCCKFRDILDIWDKPAEDVRADIQAFELLQEKVDYVRRLPRNSSGWCHAHGCYCPFRKSKLRVQGPPCPDWSTAGQRRGEQGPHLPPLLAAGAKTQETSPDVVVVENVPAFPLDLAQMCYGEAYTFYQTYHSPESVGFDFVARHRTGLWKLLEHAFSARVPGLTWRVSTMRKSPQLRTLFSCFNKFNIICAENPLGSLDGRQREQCESTRVSVHPTIFSSLNSIAWQRRN